MDNHANAFLHTFRLPIQPSPVLCRIVIFVHALCLIMAWLNGLALIAKIILTCLICVSFSVFWRKTHLEKGKGGINCLILGSEDNWQVKMQNGAVHSADLGDSLFVHPWLTIISLYFNRRRQYFIFTAETLDVDTFRRLRVRLRFRVGE